MKKVKAKGETRNGDDKRKKSNVEHVAFRSDPRLNVRQSL
jgi:hypothetical protein